VIRQVGPGGEFLSTDQTMNLFKKEHWIPELSNRDNLDAWIMKGRQDWAQIATAKARSILETHAPVPLSVDAQQELNAIRQKGADTLLDIHFTA
jgi:trimethylamine--corrinoid protein Co-methyltransferase